MTKRASCLIPAILRAARFSACNGSTPGPKEVALNQTLRIFHYYEYITEYLQLCKDAKDCVDLKKYGEKSPGDENNADSQQLNLF
jgi:hypothetical protein